MIAANPSIAGGSWRAWGVALGLWAVLAAAAGGTLWQLRLDALRGQARELSLLSLALTDDMDRGLQGAEEGLQAVRAELADGRLSPSAPDATRALRTRAELMPLVSALWLLDGGRNRFAGSDDSPLPARLDFAPALGDLSGAQIAVSRPFVDPRSKAPWVALATRFSAAPNRDATQRGWILAGIPAKALLGAFSAAAPAASDVRMAVFRSDGALLAGGIADISRQGESALAVRLAVQPGLQLRRFSDGSDHLVSFNRLPHYGVGVMLTRSLQAALLPWRQMVQLTAVAAALLLAILVLSVLVVQRANRRRGEAQRALQLQRARASRLESLGTLAGGVAHDFNNALASIVGYGEMAHDAAPAGSAQARHLDRVLQAAQRGKALAERILAFGRGGARSAIVFELQKVAEEVLALLAASLRPGVVLERALDAAGARVRGDPTQAFEAVMNLCNNAMQAMPDGGVLSVRLERVHAGSPRVLSHSVLAGGDWLALTVADQGVGITPGVMEHLFEPFFTTRGKDQGTGLGLAVVHGVVAEFGGAIDVEGRPGRGARFTLYLPESVAALDTAAKVAGPIPGGNGQEVLVVDDDPGLVALADETLRGLGYEPLGVSDPRQALQLLRDQPQRFAALVTDEVMPGLGGMALASAARAFAPRLPVLLVTGFGGPQLAQRAAAAGVTRVLAKPLVRAALAQALAEVLAAAAQQGFN
jgi:signal transduction histidine kinase/ActR/RegA family two-component response regulator